MSTLIINQDALNRLQMRKLSSRYGKYVPDGILDEWPESCIDHAPYTMLSAFNKFGVPRDIRCSSYRKGYRVRNNNLALMIELMFASGKIDESEVERLKESLINISNNIGSETDFNKSLLEYLTTGNSYDDAITCLYNLGLIKRKYLTLKCNFYSLNYSKEDIEDGVKNDIDFINNLKLPDIAKKEATTYISIIASKLNKKLDKLEELDPFSANKRIPHGIKSILEIPTRLMYYKEVELS